MVILLAHSEKKKCTNDFLCRHLMGRLISVTRKPVQKWKYGRILNGNSNAEKMCALLAFADKKNPFLYIVHLFFS